MVAAAALVQAASGFGFALIAMPLLSSRIGVESALVLSSLVSLPTSVATAWVSRASLDPVVAKRMILGTLVGMPFGLVILSVAPEKALRLVVAGTVLALAAVLRSGVRVRGRPSVVDVVAGLVSGALNTSVGTNGPPLVIALASRRTSAAPMRATLSTVFCVSGIVSLALFVGSGFVHTHDVRDAAVCAPGVILGWALGQRAFKGLNQARFELLTIVLLVASACWATYVALR